MGIGNTQFDCSNIYYTKFSFQLILLYKTQWPTHISPNHGNVYNVTNEKEKSS